MVLHHRPQEEDGGQEGPQWNGQLINYIHLFFFLFFSCCLHEE